MNSPAVPAQPCRARKLIRLTYMLKSATLVFAGVSGRSKRTAMSNIHRTEHQLRADIAARVNVQTVMPASWFATKPYHFLRPFGAPSG